MGWWPVGFYDTLKCLLLTAILFIGPLFEKGVIDDEFWEWIDGRRFKEIAHDWVDWRNYVAVRSPIPLLFFSPFHASKHQLTQIDFPRHQLLRK